MMMNLDPNKNQFSVAPVGPIVVIGRYMSLRGGMARDKVLNLVAWLVIAAEVSGAPLTWEEIRDEIEKAKVKPPPPVIRERGNLVAFKGPEENRMQKIQDFMGSLDEQEAEAVAAAIAAMGIGKRGAKREGE